MNCLECGRKLTPAEHTRGEECKRCMDARAWEDFCKSKSDPYNEAHGYDHDE